MLSIRRRPHSSPMRATGLVVLLLAPVSAFAQTPNETRTLNALRDLARAHEREEEAVRALNRRDHDRLVAEDRARRNAARDARSLRRFD